MYVSNPRNADFDDLRFYGGQRFIAGRIMYGINDDTVEILNTGLIVDIYTN